MKIGRKLFLTHGYFNGICKKCGQPTTGEYDSDGNGIIQMECVNCHWTEMEFVDTGKKKEPARRRKKNCGKMEEKELK